MTRRPLRIEPIPLGLKALARPLRAYVRLDTVHSMFCLAEKRCPVRSNRGKWWKDDQSWEGIQNYLQEKRIRALLYNTKKPSRAKLKRR